MFGNRLFSKGDLSVCRRERLAQLEAEAFRLSAEDAANPATLLRLQERYELDHVRITGHQFEVRDEPPTGTRVTLVIEYTGASDLLRYRPSEYSSSPPDAALDGERILVSGTAPDYDTDSVRRWADGILTNLEKWIGWANHDADAHYSEVAHAAQAAVAARLEHLERQERLRQELTG
jgi:hypothetical protein